MRGAQTPVGNDVVKTLVTAWKKRKIACSPLPRGCLFSFTHASSLFSSGTSGSFCKFKFSFFLIQFIFFYLSIRSLQYIVLWGEYKKIPFLQLVVVGIVSYLVIFHLIPFLLSLFKVVRRRIQLLSKQPCRVS